MPLTPAVATLASAGIGAASSLFGSSQSAKASAKQAKLNREFQERMSNTAFQRSADDLEAAGLNRILALGSPASTPGGAMGQVPDYGSAMAQGANAGIGLATGAQQINKQDAEIKKILQETDNLSEKQKQLVQQSALWETMAPIIIQAGKDYSALVGIMKAEAPAVFKALKTSGTEAVKGTMEVIKNYYNISVQSLSDTFTEMDDIWQKSGLKVTPYGLRPK